MLTGNSRVIWVEPWASEAERTWRNILVCPYCITKPGQVPISLSLIRLL